MPSRPGKILFVCLGNICRSPLAEGLMRQIQAEYKLDIELDSAGTSGYHSGEAPDPRTQQSAIKRGLDISGLRARQVRHEDLLHFDLLVAMDRNNLNTLKKTLSPAELHYKLIMLPHPEKSGELVEIPDPYYGDSRDFDAVYALLSESIRRFCEELCESS